MNNTDAFTSQQTNLYQAGRDAFALGHKFTDCTLPIGSLRREAWVNGFLDAEQSEIAGRVCEIRQ